jgi:hypothetical protein
MDSRTRSLSLAALSIASIALAFALGRRSARPTSTSASTPIAAQIAPVDPAELCPHATRFVLAADVARLRAAPSLEPLLATITSDERSCSAKVTRKVRRLLAFARDATLDDLAFVFEGSLTRDELVTCMREGRPGARTSRYREVELVQISDDRAENFLPRRDHTEVASLPGGLLIAGPSSAVRAMIDRASLPHTAASGSMPAALKALTDRLDAGYAFAMASLIKPRVGQWSSVLASVEAMAVGVRPDESLRLEALLACGDFDAPRALALGLTRARDDVASQPEAAPIRAMLERVTVERRASDVRVTATIDSADVTRLLLIARAMASDADERPVAIDASGDGGAGRD